MQRQKTTEPTSRPRLWSGSMGWSGSPPYWSVGAGAKCEGEPWSVHWMKIVGLTLTMAPNDWSALVDPIPGRSQPSIPHTSLHLETFFPGHTTHNQGLARPRLEPKRRPKGRSYQPWLWVLPD